MIEYGHLDTDVTVDQLRSINFTDYFQCYQQTPNIEKYYTKYNSSIWQMFDDECPDFIKELSGKIPQDFKHYVVSVVNIDPGQTIPYHIDKHYMLKKQFGAGESFRYLIFLEDWKRGHYYEVHDQPSLADLAVAGLSVLLKFPQGSYLNLPPELQGKGIPGLADNSAYEGFFVWRDRLYSQYRQTITPGSSTPPIDSPNSIQIE